VTDDERRVLRPVELEPAEAALAYLAVLAINVPGARVKDAASLLSKIEKAMEPDPVVASESTSQE